MKERYFIKVFLKSNNNTLFVIERKEYKDISIIILLAYIKNHFSKFYDIASIVEINNGESFQINPDNNKPIEISWSWITGYE